MNPLVYSYTASIPALQLLCKIQYVDILLCSGFCVMEYIGISTVQYHWSHFYHKMKHEMLHDEI